MGGSKLAVKPNYYRINPASDVIIECDNEEACIGGIIDDVYSSTGYCHENYYGNMCSQCKEDYAKFGGKGKCLPCVGNFKYYFKFIFFALL